MTIKTITPKELQKKLSESSPPFLVDVREPFEREVSNIGGTHIPLGQLGSRHSEIPKEGDVVIYCRSGGRSGRAVEELQKHFGYQNLINLEGGMLRWIDEVDGTLRKD